MILTVTPNAAIDRTYRIEGFSLDCVNRPTEWREAAGGKGINVARVYQRLGGRALATGFLAGETGRWILRSLEAESIEADFVGVGGESRLCIAVIDPARGSQTEINEPGPPVGEEAARELIHRISALLRVREYYAVVLCGSLPPGAPAGLYAECIRLCLAAGVRAVLDGSGAPLREGAQAAPWMIKPNVHEASSLAGRRLETESDLLSFAAAIRGTGVESVVVTQGERGAIGLSSQGAWRAEPPRVDFVSGVGSGDSFLGAFLRRLEEGGAFADALRAGTAAGAANAAVYGSGFIDVDVMRELEPRVKLTSLTG